MTDRLISVDTIETTNASIVETVRTVGQSAVRRVTDRWTGNGCKKGFKIQSFIHFRYESSYNCVTTL